jgi:hypothetical protein
MIIENRRHASQLVETLRERTLIKIECTVGKRSFRFGAPNNRSDKMVAEVAACRLSGHTGGSSYASVSLLAECRYFVQTAGGGKPGSRSQQL